MNKKLRYVALLGATSILFGANVFAKSRAKNDYDSNYYESEGPVIMKVRGMGAITKSAPKKYPEPTNSPATKPGNLIKNGIGLQGATSIFFTDHFGAELGFGGILFKVSDSALKAAQKNYGTSTANMKKKDLFGIPMELLAQVHAAPYGAIRPYAGLGYNGTYFFTQSKQLKAASSFGPVYQLGVDFVLNDDSMINIDVKQYTMEPKVTYKSNFLGNADVSGKQKINPLVISVGMGWRF